MVHISARAGVPADLPLYSHLHCKHERYASQRAEYLWDLQMETLSAVLIFFSQNTEVNVKLTCDTP